MRLLLRFAFLDSFNNQEKSNTKTSHDAAEHSTHGNIPAALLFLLDV
jgi:hypothetical protein